MRHLHCSSSHIFLYMYFVFIEGQGYNFGLIGRVLPCSVYFKVGVTVSFLHVEVTVLIFPREGVGFAYITTWVSSRILVAGER